MLRIVMTFVMLLSVTGCGSGLKFIVVQQLDENEVLEGQAVTLALANQADGDQTDETKPTECLCGGTGRSGDGLGPCACAPNCTCKAKRQEVFEEVSTAESDDSCTTLLNETIERVAQLEQDVSLLTDNQERLAEIATRLEAKQTTPGTVERDAPRHQLVVFKKCDGSCPPCDRFERLEVPKLVSSGWNVGKDELCSIVLVDVDSVFAATWPEGHENAKQAGYPFFAFYEDGKFVKGYAGYTSSNDLALDFNATLYKVKSKKPQPVTMIPTVLPTIVHPNWGTVNLETYSRNNCGCSMCVGIRQMQSDMRMNGSMMTTVPVEGIPSHQQPTPDETIDRMLSLMKLTESDGLCDLGCGDGRVLIKAANKYGCRGVGVEIDEAKADEARARVAMAGLSDKITIITGDAREFDPDEYGVTAITAYLYPDLLKQLMPKFKQVRIAATPYHRVEGLSSVKHENVYVYDNRKPSVVTGGNQWQSNVTNSTVSGCSSGRCSSGRCRSGRCF